MMSRMAKRASTEEAEERIVKEIRTANSTRMARVLNTLIGALLVPQICRCLNRNNDYYSLPPIRTVMRIVMRIIKNEGKVGET